MLFQHPEEIGYGYVVESYVTRMYGGLPRYLVLNGGRFLGPRWWHTTRFTRHLIADAAAINDEELEALLGYEWRSRLTAGWLIGVDRRERFRARIGDLLLASEVCYSGGAYCFALARFGTHADAEILTTYLDRYLPRTDLHYDQPAAMGAALRLYALLGTHHADRFTEPDGLWDEWVKGVGRLSYPATPPPNSAAGLTSTASSPTVGPAPELPRPATAPLALMSRLRLLQLNSSEMVGR
ncbi:hypothetical protein EDD95_2132 [Streptomyces sp. CEV 2-1]|uniref:DUF6000 family protein n=1 Tax=unclassified Streptomyces TaxID=2593676 RepID=UPI000F90D948|nr:DUF6000 family protein [Streptomyces sp. CEV 2-1]ROQ82516.1 hypothetical protein EDD95_2132 [Streptomyces sp. CEV 2-1]